MAELVLRPSGLPDKPWSLQLRYHESVGETEYVTIARVDEETARAIGDAGPVCWLFGKPTPTPRTLNE